jgi:hypothetical protein
MWVPLRIEHSVDQRSSRERHAPTRALSLGVSMNVSIDDFYDALGEYMNDLTDAER